MKGKERYIPGSALGAFLLLMLFAMSLSSHAQTFPFREYTTDDGLPQVETVGAIQDSRGYIWISTRNGLAKFDGHTFTSFFRRDGLPSNIVTRIFEDEAGIIWAVTPNGLARFNGKTFYGYPLPDSLMIKQVGMAFTTGKPGTFFLRGSKKDYPRVILFENGLYYDYTEIYPVFQEKKFSPLCFDKRDSSLYLISIDSSVYRLKDTSVTLIDAGPVTRNKIRDTIQLINGNRRTLWNEVPNMNSSSGLSVLATPELMCDPVLPPDTIMKTLFPGTIPVKWDKGTVNFNMVDHDGTLWLLTESKIKRLVSDAFIEFDKESGLPLNPWAIAADPEGGLWIGSINGELKYFKGEHFTKKSGFKGVFKRDPVFFRGSATLSNGEVWISTNEGVLIWNGKKFRKFKPVPEGEQVCTIYEDPVDKSILIGTGTGLYHIRGEKTDFYPEMSSSGHGVVEGIARDDKGIYWLAGHYGIVRFDGKSFTPFRPAPAPAEMVWGIIKDYTGKIWSAGSDGIFICDPDNPVFKEALPAEMNRPANVIRDLGDHRLLVGRMLDLCIIDLEKYYAGKSDYYTILGRSRGYNGNDCQDNGIVKDAKGNWWLLANDKLICFYPDRIKKNNKPPVTHITSVEIPDKTTGWVTVLDTSLFYGRDNSLSVSGRNNDLRINYTGITTRYPEEVTYQYRLSGLHEEWSPRTAEQSVVLDDLSPGNYTFELNAFNSDGMQTTEPATLVINIIPTFFQKLGIQIAAAFMAIALIVFLSFQVRRRIHERRLAIARQQAESYKMQLSAVISQLDPHFTFNAVSSVGSLIMKGEKEKAYAYLLKISGLLRSVLTDSSVLLKPIKDEVEFVKRFLDLQKLRYGNRFDYSIKVAEDVDLNTLVPKMILHSIVDNAVKHGIENKKDKGMIEIEVNKVKNGHEFVVRDNGIGRKAASELNTDGAGLGLKNIISGMEMINRANSEKATLTFTDLYDNGKPSGTEVHGFLPSNYTFDIAVNIKQHRIKHNRL